MRKWLIGSALLVGAGAYFIFAFLRSSSAPALVAGFRPLFRDPKSEALLATRVPVFSVRQGTDTFWELCKTIEWPCGEEAARVNDPEISAPPGGIKFENLTVKEILNRIVPASYRWNIRTGVLNLEPADQRERLLSQQLGPMTLRHTSSARAIFNVLGQAGIRPAWQGPGRERIKFFDLEFKGGTVRDALNAIAVGDGQIMWFFTADAAGRPLFSNPNWGPYAKNTKEDVEAERERFKQDYKRLWGNK